MADETPETKQELQILPFSSQAEWEAWLGRNHLESRGLWLKIAKRGAGVATVSYPEALDSALCHGWIDGQRGSYDERFFLQKFTPRRARSKWSQINREKVTKLLEQGRVRPAGLAQVDQAKADGRWEAAYEPQSTATVPEDLQRELDANPAAKEFFATLKGPNRYAILYRLQDAKKPETRARRLEKFVTMLAERKTLYP